MNVTDRRSAQTAQPKNLLDLLKKAPPVTLAQRRPTPRPTETARAQ